MIQVEEKKELAQLTAELIKKGSWIRKGFQEFLANWKNETNYPLEDESIERVIVSESIDGVVYLKRGINWLCGLSGDEFNEGEFDSASKIEVSHMDMKALKEIISELPAALQEYAKKMKKRDKEYDSLLGLLKVS